MKVMDRKISSNSSVGFTIIELLIVVVIIGIASLLAIPMISSGADFQIRAAANMIAADMEYAKSLAITNQDSYLIVFDADGDSYQMQDINGDVVDDPTRAGSGVAVDFGSDSRFSQIDISSVSFDGTDTVEFDYLGVPYNGSFDSLSSGSVVLTAGAETRTIVVEPITGYIIIE
jgi:prepilin-type N-terminal cleavage/methylation domain-containing protein